MTGMDVIRGMVWVQMLSYGRGKALRFCTIDVITICCRNSPPSFPVLLMEISNAFDINIWSDVDKARLPVEAIAFVELSIHIHNRP